MFYPLLTLAGGQVTPLTFIVSGLYEGLFVMEDDATHSQWLHYTGECIFGPSAGAQIEMLPSEITRFGNFRSAHPDGSITAPTNALWRRVLGWFETYFSPPTLPGMFRRTMTDADRRLPEMMLGLGVVQGQRNLIHGLTPAARFFPMQAVRDAGMIVDKVGDHDVLVAMDAEQGAPVAYLLPGPGVRLEGDDAVDPTSGARWQANGKDVDGVRLPLAMGIFGRWYGFSQTYPATTIWER